MLSKGVFCTYISTLVQIELKPLLSGEPEYLYAGKRLVYDRESVCIFRTLTRNNIFLWDLTLSQLYDIIIEPVYEQFVKDLNGKEILDCGFVTATIIEHENGQECLKLTLPLASSEQILEPGELRIRD